MASPNPGVAEFIRTWLDARITEVERGDIARARAGLEAHRWWNHFDLMRVSLYPLIRIDELVVQAADHLADRALDPAEATRALRAARAIVARTEVP